ncbi:MAG: hypothetical protein FJ319_12930 [SAR202 cluster bacterium]|nr:hypothetical protein [SAR202 cluster bacterium]
MLIVTEPATEHLTLMLKRARRAEGQVIRLAVDAYGNVNLVLDVVRQGDQVIPHHGEHVMVVEPPISEKFSGIALDVVWNGHGRELTLHRAA